MVSRPPATGTRSFREALLAAAADLGCAMSDHQADQMATHHRLLLDWGRRLNLTGLKDEREILRRHFLEPIVAAELLGSRGRLVDLGSGNGFPAIPLRVLRPGLELVLVEASERKSAFLWAVLRELGLKEARVETRRIEGRSDLAGLLPCRYLTLRAVKARDLLKGRGGSLLEPDGRALFFVSSDDSRAFRDRPIPSLRWTGERALPSGPGSVVAVLEHDAGD